MEMTVIGSSQTEVPGKQDLFEEGSGKPEEFSACTVVTQVGQGE
jgi:hypothetical protein